MSTNKKAPWTPAENLALARIYFTMLHAATNGHPYNKAQMIRTAQGISNREDIPHDARAPLHYRSRGSIEAKLMNASAAHRDLIAEGLLAAGPTMATHGYKAWGNYQSTLKDAVIAEAYRLAEMRKAEGVA